ncbi:MAG: hypothetical protein JWN15_4095, partial [Firmicutes bacterium]|nr:hypothetical protein [Bacillota bacterium]
EDNGDANVRKGSGHLIEYDSTGTREDDSEGADELGDKLPAH